MTGLANRHGVSAPAHSPFGYASRTAAPYPVSETHMKLTLIAAGSLLTAVIAAPGGQRPWVGPAGAALPTIFDAWSCGARVIRRVSMIGETRCSGGNLLHGAPME